MYACLVRVRFALHFGFLFPLSVGSALGEGWLSVLQLLLSSLDDESPKSYYSGMRPGRPIIALACSKFAAAPLIMIPTCGRVWQEGRSQCSSHRIFRGKPIIGVFSQNDRGLAIFSCSVLGCERAERQIVGVSKWIVWFFRGEAQTLAPPLARFEMSVISPTYRHHHSLGAGWSLEVCGSPPPLSNAVSVVNFIIYNSRSLEMS